MTEPIKQIVQVVKRFGPCGGMEEYVFQLSKELVSAGLNVLVLCEKKVSCPKHIQFDVIELGSSIRKPRWLSHILFSRKVKNWVNKNPLQGRIIHSHERISCQHITTIHSTLFNFPPKGLPSFRKLINEWLEKREVLGANVQAIVPVSTIIKGQISEKFTNAIPQLSHPVNPGVEQIELSNKDRDNRRIKTIGFIGNEWKRKGLEKVISIWRMLKKTNHEYSLILAGFDPSTDIGLSTEEKKDVQILGWIEDKAEFYSQIDILIHPAKREAYGMVIPEALSLGIPVLCSKECGAAETITEGQGDSLMHNEPDHIWADLVTKLLANELRSDARYERPWSTVAKEYMKIYREISLA
jgi:UDP-glucose:(heptosyl)LPS alpha-1,3-glucosyltransferase